LDFLCGQWRFFFISVVGPLALRLVIFPVLPLWGTLLWRRFGKLRGGLALFLPPMVLGLSLEVGVFSFLWAVQWMALGPILAECLHRDWGISRAMGTALIATLALQAGVMALWAIEAGEFPWRLLQREMEKILNQASHLPIQGQGPSSLPKELIPELARAAVIVFPGLLASLDLMLHWWNLLVQRRLPRLWNGRPPGPENLDEWGIPFHLVWVTIGGGLLILSSLDPLKSIGVNVVLAMAFVHLLQGVAVVAFLLRKKGAPRFLRWLVFGAIFLQHFFTAATAAIGLFDVWFDFRRRLGTTSQLWRGR
jgi:hypothetical protein